MCSKNVLYAIKTYYYLTSHLILEKVTIGTVPKVATRTKVRREVSHFCIHLVIHCES